MGERTHLAHDETADPMRLDREDGAFAIRHTVVAQLRVVRVAAHDPDERPEGSSVPDAMLQPLAIAPDPPERPPR